MDSFFENRFLFNIGGRCSVGLALLIWFGSAGAHADIKEEKQQKAPSEQGHTFEEDIPPELRDIDKSSRKDGFAEMFSSYNPRGFTLYSAAVGYRSQSGLEYFSGNNFYGEPGSAEPIYYKTKQNFYYGLDPQRPFDLSTQAVYAADACPIYRLGVRWRVSSTRGFKNFFDYLHFAYAVNFEPVQIDSIPGYNWQVEHTYQVDFPDISFVKGLSVHGVIDQDGGGADSKFSYSNRLSLPVIDTWSAFTEYKYSRNLPTSRYNGSSYGIEYRISF